MGIRERDINKATSKSKYGHYEFTIVPFQLTNAPIEFMCLMSGIFRNYLDKFIIFFLDDTLICSKNEKEHEEYFGIALQALRENQLYSKLRKCSLYQGHTQYLGHIIYGEGIAVDPEILEAIRGWPTPYNVSEVRYFMGLEGYYRRFIEGFPRLHIQSHPYKERELNLNGHQSLRKVSKG